RRRGIRALGEKAQLLRLDPGDRGPDLVHRGLAFLEQRLRVGAASRPLSLADALGHEGELARDERLQEIQALALDGIVVGEAAGAGKLGAETLARDAIGLEVVVGARDEEAALAGLHVAHEGEDLLQHLASLVRLLHALAVLGEGVQALEGGRGDEAEEDQGDDEPDGELAPEREGHARARASGAVARARYAARVWA